MNSLYTTLMFVLSSYYILGISLVASPKHESDTSPISPNCASGYTSVLETPIPTVDIRGLSVLIHLSPGLGLPMDGLSIFLCTLLYAGVLSFLSSQYWVYLVNATRLIMSNLPGPWQVNTEPALNYSSTGLSNPSKPVMSCSNQMSFSLFSPASTTVREYSTAKNPETKETVALTVRSSPRGSELYNMFPINHRPKYPIAWTALLNRINNLISEYALPPIAKIYTDCSLNKNVIRGELKHLGGIYLWWCSETGKFYVGSAKSFSGSNASRLDQYFQPGRLARTGSNKRISTDLASDMLTYSKDNWNLIILEICGNSSDLNLETLSKREQFWMLLIPTYNRSLVVGTHDGTPMEEEVRRARSTVIYRYTLKDGKVVPGE